MVSVIVANRMVTTEWTWNRSSHPHPRRRRSPAGVLGFLDVVAYLARSHEARHTRRPGPPPGFLADNPDDFGYMPNMPEDRLLAGVRSALGVMPADVVREVPQFDAARIAACWRRPCAIADRLPAVSNGIPRVGAHAGCLVCGSAFRFGSERLRRPFSHRLAASDTHPSRHARPMACRTSGDPYRTGGTS
jgi:hypothetical protein